MSSPEPGTPPVMWRPGPAQLDESALAGLMHRTGTKDYASLHAWSVADVGRFWTEAVIEAEDVLFDGALQPALASAAMPGASWFPSLQVSYPEHVFRDRDDEAPAIFASGEVRGDERWTWAQLRDETRRVREGLVRMGVQSGDRVAGYLPHLPETIACFLATTSLGAVWTCCSPDLGARTVIERFAQIEPKVLIAIDGYRYGGRDFSRSDVVTELEQQLPSLQHVVRLGYLDTTAGDYATRFPAPEQPLRFERVAFDHPLWILYSSGTTGQPKAIVHGHGGVLLEHLKSWRLQLDVRAGDRVLWFTTTGWMMWNFTVSALLVGAAVVCVDGSPGHPDMGRLWDIASRFEVTLLGTGAAYLHACADAKLRPGDDRDLSRLRAVGATGSPLAPIGYQWVYEALGADIWLFSLAGGTDVVTAFVGACPVEPVYEGELQAAALGVDAQAWDDSGRRVVDQLGELVIAQPMPSMPVGFFNDPGGERYRDSYFSTYPGVWRHGDWIRFTSRGTSVITGRSDSTINRAGIRIGTAEIYSAVLAIDQISDAMAVDVPPAGPAGQSRLLLFVVLKADAQLDEQLVRRIQERIRKDASPRHLPDEILQVDAVPRTLTGKLLEVPIKRLLMGADLERVVSRDALANPEALDWFERYAVGRSES